MSSRSGSGWASPRSSFGSAYNRAAVSRNAPTVLALVLLAATATAFAVTQRLKLQPNPIRLDTQPPSIPVTRLRSNGPKLTVLYTVSEPAHAILVVDGRRAVYTYSTRRHGHLTWYGRVNGRAVPARHHRLAILAEDL